MVTVADRTLVTATPSLFAHHASRGRWLPKPHLCLIDDLLLEAVTRGGVRACVSMPPRHGKSELGSKYGPAWVLGVRPDWRIMLGAYEATFAASWGRRARDVLAEWGALFGVRLHPEVQARDAWQLAPPHEGGMVTAGAGGAFTGRGANLMLIDDPIKNSEQALSETYREKVWDWWQGTLASRLEPGGSVIVTMTRWHEDDLIGRLLAHETGWREVRIPALAEDNDPLGRRVGEALWPERFSVEDLERIRAEQGSYWFNAQYQGRPSPAEGRMLQRGWWRFHDAPPADADQWITSWDMDFGSTNPGSSFVVGQVWARRGALCYLVDQVRGRWEFPDAVRQVVSVAQRYPQCSTHLVEDKANGPAVIQTLRGVLPGVVPARARESKEARVAAISPVVEAGQVFLPRASWVDGFVDECAAFPNGVHDDQVDALAHALRRLTIGRVGAAPNPFS